MQRREFLAGLGGLGGGVLLGASVGLQFGLSREPMRYRVVTCPEAQAFRGRHREYERACRMAGVPLEEVGAVCVVEVRVLRNYWTGLPNLHDVWRWRRVEDLRSGDNFRVLWQYGYDRAGDWDFDRRYTDSRREAQIYLAESDALTKQGDRMSTSLTVTRI